ncbi:uncharacterized protein LOC111642685 [Centruroides sculpturatus]|uniref:uncharacterized protein LOC111642685 n=1 Tax=Centruroides sculpturatus TaxID=218467 RepID=UPI000C6E83E5|nr:uncharacterized protein LOC111642685 [Centruroides sculpturatus]
MKIPDYEGEIEKVRYYQRIANYTIGIAYAFPMCLLTFVNLIVFKEIEKNSSYSRAIVCSVFFQIVSIYESTIWMWHAPVVILIGIIINDRFKALSVQLQQAKTQWPKKNIDRLISKHVEFCDVIENINEKCNKYVFALYGLILCLVSFVIYTSVFRTEVLHLRVIMWIVTIVVTMIIFFCVFSISRCVSSIYDSFQEIRRITSAYLSLQDKLKVGLYRLH